MELMRGETLKYRLQRGAVPLPELLEWSSQMADALDAAHDAGTIHRDIKPANLFITTHAQAKVLGFGLARAAIAQPASPRPHNGATETIPWVLFVRWRVPQIVHSYFYLTRIGALSCVYK
jgi:serine/threonine protein kinase